VYQLVQYCLKLSLITTISGYRITRAGRDIGVALHSSVTQSSKSSTTTVCVELTEFEFKKKGFDS